MNVLPRVLIDDTPWSARREELLDLLRREEYGYFPKEALSVTFKEGGTDGGFCAGKANTTRIEAQIQLDTGVFTFPFRVTAPKGEGPHPFFVYIAFSDAMSDKYLPIEEIIDRGFAVLHFCYNDVTADKIDNDPRYDSRIFDLLFDGPAPKDGCGTIAVWAWAASRVMDYAVTRKDLDLTRAGVLGHSRLGKTALLAGATDTRFTHVFSNDSGCSGAAITRDKEGERIAEITKTFPYWFCENYHAYAGREEELPFDQHFLLAAIAPRKVYVGSAVGDIWADPKSEFRACVAASQVYEALGLTGLVAPDRLPEVGDAFHAGNVGYHLRAGTHYLSREDWGHYMDYLAR